jgi:hypothetical protein
MPESVSGVDAILDGLRDRATGWSCVPLADAVAAVHAAADAGRAAGHAADVKLLLDLAGSYQGSPYKLNAIAYEMAAKEIAARFPNGGTND